MKTIIILASGRGSHFENICQSIQNQQLPLKIKTLITNNPSAPVIKKAQKFSVPTQIFDYPRLKKEKGREFYEKILLEYLLSQQPFDFILLAGYMLILSPLIVNRFPMKIINIHPSLLPAFKGLKATQQAWEYGVKYTGATVHFVDNSLDGGIIIDQQPFEIKQNSFEEFEKELLKVEHQLYKRALYSLCTRSFYVDQRRLIWK